MSVKLHEIMGAAHARSASLAAEVAGYLVLATADQIAGAPRSLGFADVSLSEEGQIRIAGGTPVDDVRAEQTLREILGSMLLEASSVTPGLLRAAHKSAQGGIDALIREIEVALVPVNRAAARRALARLYRDVERARQAGRLAPWEAPRPAAAPAARPATPPAPEPAPRSATPPVPAPAPRLATPPAPAPVQARAPEPVPAPSDASVELPAVLARDSQPPPIGAGERSWLTPDSVAVVEVEWPLKQLVQNDDELLTAIPIYVEELAAEEPEVAVPEVPDLEVPVSEDAPEVRVIAAPEPITVPQPLVAPSVARARESAREGQTPVLGSRLAVLEAPPAPLEISERTPAVLVLAGDDATERMPSVIDDEEDAAAEITRALEEVSRAFVEPPEPVDGLETLDPPLAGAAERAPITQPLAAAPEPVPSPEPAPAAAEPELFPAEALPEVAVAAVEPEPLPAEGLPSPLPEVLAAAAELEHLAAEPSPSPQPEVLSPQDALDRLAGLPARPVRHDYAPPRYAPRKSDVQDLLSGFGVASIRTERELCSDLKALAGVDETAPPPMVELSETPPPVAVMDLAEGEAPAPRASEGSNARVVAGAVSAALVIAGIGLGSIPTRTSETAAAGAPLLDAPSGAERVTPCSAELTVRQVPAQSRARLRAGADGSVVAPSRVVGSDAVFEGLACGQSAEVTVELPGRARWVRIPVAADALSPSAEAPGLVRYTVALR